MQGLNPLTMQCTYSTPCGWCTKWDKKCDKKIGCEPTNNNPQRGLRSQVSVYDDVSKLPNRLIKKIIEDYTDYENAMNNIKSGKLPPLKTNNTYGLGRTKYD